MTTKLVCGVFSYKLVSIALLSFPVLGFILGLLYKFIGTDESFEVNTDDLFLLFLFACTCISGLLGIERKNTSLLKPVLWTILILIVSGLILVVRLIVKEFDFKNGEFSSNDVGVEFRETLIAELVVLYVGYVISTYYWDRIGEYELPQLTQTSKSNPSSKALLINV